MQTFYLKKKEAFSVFIENPGGSWFEISGNGKFALTPGRYFDSEKAQEEIKRLRSLGFKNQQTSINS